MQHGTLLDSDYSICYLLRKAFVDCALLYRYRASANQGDTRNMSSEDGTGATPLLIFEYGLGDKIAEDSADLLELGRYDSRAFNIYYIIYLCL